MKAIIKHDKLEQQIYVSGVKLLSIWLAIDAAFQLLMLLARGFQSVDLSNQIYTLINCTFYFCACWCAWYRPRWFFVPVVAAFAHLIVADLTYFRVSGDPWPLVAATFLVVIHWAYRQEVERIVKHNRANFGSLIMHMAIKHPQGESMRSSLTYWDKIITRNGPG